MLLPDVRFHFRAQQRSCLCVDRVRWDGIEWALRSHWAMWYALTSQGVKQALFWQTTTLSCSTPEQSKPHGLAAGSEAGATGQSGGSQHPQHPSPRPPAVWKPARCRVIYQNCINPANAAAIWPRCRPARASPRDGWALELISCSARQMNCFGRKYQRSLRVVRHKGCWILTSCFPHPWWRCCFASQPFGESPARGPGLVPSFQPASGNASDGNKSKAALGRNGCSVHGASTTVCPGFMASPGWWP